MPRSFVFLFSLLFVFLRLKYAVLNTDKIAFIINTDSGNAFKRASKNRLLAFIKAHSDYPVYTPKSAEESAEIVKQLVQQNYAAVFACGGDGTLNAISKQLLYSETALGIIPLGSGNGFARNFRIPLKWAKAMDLTKNHREIRVDTGKVNGTHFINVAGIGYSAFVSKAFDQVQGRGVWGYFKVVLQNLKRDNRKAKFRFPGHERNFTGWTFEVFNGTQWGGGISVAPHSKCDDGLLQMVSFKKISDVELPYMAMRVALNLHLGNRYVQRENFAEGVLQFEGTLSYQVDGDYVGELNSEARFEVLPKSLKVWIPA